MRLSVDPAAQERPGDSAADQHAGEHGRRPQPRGGMPPSGCPNAFAHDFLLMPMSGLSDRAVRRRR
ncbi:MAG TPA: hypothetical protein VGC06_28430, partial [Actinomycetes bacterium]